MKDFVTVLWVIASVILRYLNRILRGNKLELE